MVEKFKTGLTTCMAEKEELETALEQEKESRERDKGDKERWKERMSVLFRPPSPTLDVSLKRDKFT
jgi:hypothetical protein